MPRRTLTVERPLAEVWRQLQRLETWEGLGGLTDLNGGQWDDNGELAGFRFALETPLGKIRDSAEVVAAKPNLRATAESKGLQVVVALCLTEGSLTEGSLAEGDGAVSTTMIDFDIDAKATSFVTRMLETTLRSTLENGIDREREKLAERLAE